MNSDEHLISKEGEQGGSSQTAIKVDDVLKMAAA
jgi:hypothetical protein